MEVCGAVPHLPKFDFIAVPVLLWDAVMDPYEASVKQKSHYCLSFYFFSIFYNLESFNAGEKKNPYKHLREVTGTKTTEQ